MKSCKFVRFLMVLIIGSFLSDGSALLSRQSSRSWADGGVVDLLACPDCQRDDCTMGGGKDCKCGCQGTSNVPPEVGSELSAEAMDKALGKDLFARLVRLFNLEKAWIDGYKRGGPGGATFDVGVKLLAISADVLMTSTIMLGFSEAGGGGKAGAFAAAFGGITFSDRLERYLINLPGFENVRGDVSARINRALDWNPPPQ